MQFNFFLYLPWGTQPYGWIDLWLTDNVYICVCACMCVCILLNGLVWFDCVWNLPYLWFLMFLLLWNIRWLSLQHFEFRLLRVNFLLLQKQLTIAVCGLWYTAADKFRPVICYFLLWSGYDFTSTWVKFSFLTVILW